VKPAAAINTDDLRRLARRRLPKILFDLIERAPVTNLVFAATKRPSPKCS